MLKMIVTRIGLLHIKFGTILIWLANRRNMANQGPVRIIRTIHLENRGPVIVDHPPGLTFGEVHDVMYAMGWLRYFKVDWKTEPGPTENQP